MMNATTQARSKVYFVQNRGNGHVKIGYSADVRKRVASLRVSSSDPLSLIRVIDGGRKTEAWLHKRFDSHKIQGEWFSFHPDMLDVIAPDEVPIRQRIVKRRDVLLTLRERTKNAERLADEIGLTAQQALFSLSSGFSEDEARAVLDFLRGEVSE